MCVKKTARWRLAWSAALEVLLCHFDNGKNEFFELGVDVWGNFDKDVAFATGNSGNELVTLPIVKARALGFVDEELFGLVGNLTEIRPGPAMDSLT